MRAASNSSSAKKHLPLFKGVTFFIVFGSAFQTVNLELESTPLWFPGILGFVLSQSLVSGLHFMETSLCLTSLLERGTIPAKQSL
jgi:uncharacterized protein YgiB involved in biofilm formation